MPKYTKTNVYYEAAIRITPQDIALVRQVAGKLGISVTEFVRRAIKEKLVRMIPVPDPTETSPEN